MPEDAADLHAIFLDVVGELFVVPSAIRRTREHLATRRKIGLPARPERGKKPVVEKGKDAESGGRAPDALLDEKPTYWSGSVGRGTNPARG